MEITYVRSDADPNTNDGKARKFALDGGCRLVRYVGKWHQYDVYQTLGFGTPPEEPISLREYVEILDEPLGMYPPLVLVGAEVIRWSRVTETKQFWKESGKW